MCGMSNDVFGGRVPMPLRPKPTCPSCPLWQDRMYRPVCGTDGKTYERECQLEKVSCETFGDVELDHYGECGSQMLNDGGMGGLDGVDYQCGVALEMTSKRMKLKKLVKTLTVYLNAMLLFVENTVEP